MTTRRIAHALFYAVAIVVITIAIALHVRRLFEEKVEPTVPFQQDTATARAWVDFLSAANVLDVGEKGVRAALQRTLEGVTPLRPGVRTVYDTIIDSIPVPVFVHVGIKGQTKLVFTYLTPDRSGGFRPVRDSAITITNCDERLDFVAGKAICDPARAGHLGAFIELGLSLPFLTPPHADSLGVQPRVGLQWRPHYRSADGADLSIDLDRRVVLRARKGIWF